MVSPPPRTQHPPLPVPIQVRPRGRTAPAKPWMPSSMGMDPPSSPSAWSLLLIWAGGDPCVPLVCLSVPCSRADGGLCVPSTPPHPAPSSLFAGCRGGLFTLAQARLKLGICYQLFSRLLRQDLAFFQGTPAGRGGSPSFPPRPQGPQPHH